MLCGVELRARRLFPAVLPGRDLSPPGRFVFVGALACLGLRSEPVEAQSGE